MCPGFASDGGGKETKTTGEEYSIHGPTVSNDDKKLAFVVRRNVTFDPNSVDIDSILSMSFDTRLFVLDLKTYQSTVIPVSCRTIEAWYGMSWGTDNKYILATVVKNDLYDPLSWAVWKISVVDSRREIIDIRTKDKDPICQKPLHNPRANEVIFCSVMPSNKLMVVDLDTRVSRVLDQDISRLGFTYDHSGSKIYYCKKDGIWCIEKASGAKKKVLDVAATLLDVSPDSKQIAYLIQGDEKSSLFAYDVDTKTTKVISTDADIIFQWSKGGSYLLYTENPGSQEVVKAYSLATNTYFEIKKGDYPVSVGQGKGVIFIHDRNELWYHNFITKKSKRIFSCDDLQ